MLKLETKKREPDWFDASHIAAGVRFKLAPVTPAMILAARSAGSNMVLTGLKDAKIGEGSGDSALALEGRGEAAFTRLMVISGLLEWEGVGDLDGNPIDPSPDAIDALLSNWRFFQFFDREYVNPALSPASEKNGSSPSRNGTSGARTRVKRTAGTARKRARRVPTS